MKRLRRYKEPCQEYQSACSHTFIRSKYFIHIIYILNDFSSLGLDRHISADFLKSSYTYFIFQFINVRLYLHIIYSYSFHTLALRIVMLKICGEICKSHLRARRRTAFAAANLMWALSLTLHKISHTACQRTAEIGFHAHL